MNAKSTLPRDTDGRLSKWAWPGGYPLFYLDGQNSLLCPDCARKSDEDPDEVPGFKPVACDANWEDPDLFCDNCSTRIESAYVEDCEEVEQ
jgi:hypothetical protein